MTERRVETPRGHERIWARTVVVAVALLVLGSCTSSKTGLPDAPLRLRPDVAAGQHHASHVVLTLVVDGKQLGVELDTGSIYWFLTASGDLTCPDPATFTWGSGSATFCEQTAPLEVVAPDGSTVEVHPALKMGEAKFTDDFPPIIGFSANMQGKNVGGLEPVVDQLEPDVLSFRFPGGPMEDGVAQFSPLPADALRGVTPVPLVDPGSLKYGYTSNIFRVDFIAQNEVKASIITEPDGVYLETDGNRTQIAETNLAFFDTGATEPYVPVNGDISLMSDRVGDAVIFPKGKEPYDEVRYTLDAGDGKQVVLSNDQIRSYGTGAPGLAVPTAEDYPSGMKQLTTVVGLGTLGGYDFQFDFEDGRATQARFIPH